MSEESELVGPAVEKQVWGEPTLTAEEVAEQAGVSLEWLMQLRRALGVSGAEADVKDYDERDLEAAQQLKMLQDAGVPPETLLEVTRVLGVGMARFAESVRDLWVASFVEDDAEPQEAAVKLAEMAEHFLPVGAAQLSYVFERQLREILRHDVADLGKRSAGGGRIDDVAIGFADIVGFSELGEQLDGVEMGRIADGLASRAHELVASPVRLVKTIGDGVMLASSDPAPLVETLLELAEPREGEPAVRGGLAYGPALHRMGDYYGHTVNVASRVAQRARPGSVLATGEVKERSEDRFEWSSAGPKNLKGVGTLGTYRARRRDQE